MQMLNKMKLSVFAVSVGMTLGLISCGGGGGGGGGQANTPWTGHAWFDPAIIAEQNAAPTDEAKEAIAKTRAQALVAAMSEDQKLGQLTGAGTGIVPELPQCEGGRHVLDIPELGIRTLRITNGPVGIGQNDCAPAGTTEMGGQALVSAFSDKGTALPSAIAMAASFDRNTARLYGEVIATEMDKLALDVFEAPGVNMARIPLLGRNFEYFGEDPFLSGTMAVEESRAIQAAGRIAMPKHFVANEQETMRQKTYSTVEDQVLREIYLIPFEMAVKDAKVGSIMCAYNYLNGVQACENDAMQNKILRDEWGWTGYIQSDFMAARTFDAALLGGMDHEMPNQANNPWKPDNIRASLDNPASGVTWAKIDQALERRFTQMFKLGILDRPIQQTPIDFAADGEKAREIGVKSSVLLKNRANFLPLPTTLGSSDYVTIIGKETQIYAQQAVMGGGKVGVLNPEGSSDVIPEYTVAPVEGIANALGVSVGSNKVRLILVDDANALASVNGTSMNFADALNNIINQTANKAVVIMAGTIAEEGGDRGTVAFSTNLPPAMESYCGFSDACLVTSIGWDTDTNYHPKFGMSLDWYSDRGPGVQTKKANTKDSGTQAMIDTIMTTGNLKDRTVLVLKDNASFSVPDSLLGVNGPASILEVWFPGQEDGNIIADLIFGKVNPSGKLPVTFPKADKGFMDYITEDQFPGQVKVVPGVGSRPVVEYSEGLNMGYRWYDANFVSGAGCTVSGSGENACVAFPFGYGLSYTTFGFTNLSVAANGGKYDVKVKVSNTGSKKGAEVVQVYLQLPASANTGRLAQPPKRLVGFAKVELEAGAQQNVTITIDPDASNHPLGVWDTTTHAWVIPAGSYTVLVGNSSSLRDLTSAGTFTR
jgi:beta-glucosidase